MVDAAKTEQPDEWRSLTIRLRDESKRQIAALKDTQESLEQWYGAKPGKSQGPLDLKKCPALLRAMQIIRLLRETVAECEEELRDADDTTRKQ